MKEKGFLRGLTGGELVSEPFPVLPHDPEGFSFSRKGGGPISYLAHSTCSDTLSSSVVCSVRL